VPDKAQGSGPKPMFGDSDLKALRAFVGGYLHQDFVAEHKTPATALDAYCREAGRREILELESDLDRFIKRAIRPRTAFRVGASESRCTRTPLANGARSID
jgi:hypothetical protein